MPKTTLAQGWAAVLESGNAPMTSSNPTIGTKVGRARRSLSQLWQVPTFCLGLLALIGAAASAPWRYTPAEREFEALSQAIRRAFADPDTKVDSLVVEAEQALASAAALPSRSAEAHFLVG